MDKFLIRDHDLFTYLGDKGQITAADIYVMHC
jgi:hypothetical protein